MMRVSLQIGLAVLAWTVVVATSTAAEPRRPNIVFLLADDMGPGQLGCFGQKLIRTPNIDRLAAEGMRFTQCYAGCCVCAPSRSTLMTGLHTGHTPVRRNGGGNPLLPEDVTVAEVLKSAGYATGLFGKWGLGDEGTTGIPTKQGFDEFLGYLHQVHAHFYYPYYLCHNEGRLLLPGNDGGKREQYSHDLITDAALDFVWRHKQQPFFLYLAFTIPHVELLVPEDSLAEYRGKFPETPLATNGHYASQPTPRAALAGMITRLDRSVGQVMALLKELNLDDNTIVFFTSDNGGAVGAGTDAEFFNSTLNLRGHKGALYEGGIRTPMIVRWPGKVQPATTNNLAWAFWDFLPTAAELAGAQPPPNLDGLSVVPTLMGEKAAGRSQSQHDYLYWEQPAGKNLLQAVHAGDWKAVRLRASAPLELYNLATNPGESTNVAAEHPDVAARLEKLLTTARTETRDYPPDATKKTRADYMRD